MRIPVNHIYISWACLLFLLPFMSHGQEVEHNFLVGPQITTCDSLPEDFYNEDEAIYLVENATFRSNAKFRINRSHGVKGGWYYSCDNKTGFLIILIDDQKHIFQFVPNETWDQLTKTTDFESFIINQLKSFKVNYSGD